MATFSPSAPDFGVDVSTFPVPDTSFGVISGFRVLAEALARRLLTRKGLLVFHPSYGIDLRDYLNEAMDDATMARAKAEITLELRQDERVAEVDATLVYTSGTQTLAATVKGQSANGPFSFVLQVSQVDVNLYIGAA